MGLSPLHASTSTFGLIRNLNKNRMSPYFDIVYNNLLQTARSAEGDTPTECPELIVFSCFRSDLDDSNFVPGLADECLTPVDLVRCHESELNHQNQASYQDGATTQWAPYNVPTQRVPPQDETAPQKEPHDAPAQYRTTATHRAPHQVKDLPFVDAIQDKSPALTSPHR